MEDAMPEKLFWEFGLYGALGGFISTLVKCGYIELPRLKDHRLYLGGLTGVVLGIVAGALGDNNPANAFMWGAGSSAIMQGLVQVADGKFGLACKSKGE